MRPTGNSDRDDEPDAAAEAPAGEHRRVAAPDDAAGERLDRLLARSLDGLSRSRIKALIDEGRVSTDGRILADAAHRVKQGQIFDVFIPEPEPAKPLPQPIPLNVVHEDDEVLVIDKPADMVVHPAAGNPDGTLVNALLHYCGDRLSGIGGVRRPGIVHRLDKDTSGLMVVAKTDRAHAALAAQFEHRTLSRTYLAVVHGVPHPAEGEIAGAIGRCPTDRQRMAVVTGGGKPALTRYRVVWRFGAAAALVQCTLMTGRTHQIRVHLASIGHPVVGDPLYGGRVARTASRKFKDLPEPVREALVHFPRQALHAVDLRFRHPASAATVSFSSELPLDIQGLIHSLESI